MTRMDIAVLFTMALICAGCTGLPTMPDIHKKFMEEHPNCVIQNLELNQQSIDGQPVPAYAQFHITYTRKDDTNKHEEVWHFHHAAESWVEGKKETIR